MVFITYKVLNLVSSDTIACVLELLFGIVYGLFPRPLKVSIQAFDIVQFSRSCWLPLSKQLAYYNSLCFVCQALFWIIFQQSFKWKQPFQPFGWPLSCDSLLIILLQTPFVNYFFQTFFKFFHSVLPDSSPYILYYIIYNRKRAWASKAPNA